MKISYTEWTGLELQYDPDEVDASIVVLKLLKDTLKDPVSKGVTDYFLELLEHVHTTYM